METNKWWIKSEEQAHEAVIAAIRNIDRSQAQRNNKNLVHMRLYGNQDISGFTPSTYSSSLTLPNSSSQPGVKLNIIYSMISTLASKITKNSPRVMITPVGGEWSNRKRAKNLTKFLDGIFYETKLYQEAIRVFTDALVFDLGALKIYPCDDKIVIERVFPNEIKVDNMDGMYGKPRQLYQCKYVPLERLITEFPEYEMRIRNAIKDVNHQYISEVELVEVIEAWHLKSGSDETDGKHVICIEGVTLFYEDYDSCDFPFVFFRWTEKLLGFYGQGLAEQLVGIQTEINKILKTMQLGLHLCSVPYWLVESSSKINKAHLSNQIGNIIEYSITKPELATGSGVSPDLFNHLNWLINQAYQITGLSQLSASSQKPAGLNSGVALREYHDIESERFYSVGKAYEHFFLGAASHFIEVAKYLSKNNSGFSIKTSEKGWGEFVDWSDVNMEEDAYLMQMYPTNFLPATPAGKMETLKEMMQMGLITSREEIIDQLEYPDLERLTNLATATLHEIEMMIEKMLDPDEPEYQSPDPITNLELARNLAQSAYLDAKIKGAYEENLELLRRFINECIDLQAATQAPQQAATQAAQPTGV